MARTKKDTSNYEGFKAQQAEISRERSAAGREIGPLPSVVDPARREACKFDLELFARTYFPSRFFLPLATIHLAAIVRMARCTESGGLFACAMPRGSGKTTIAEVAVLHALLYGFRRFVVLVAATEGHATKALRRIQTELETNDLLLEDFPEACFPIRALERIHNRAKGQTLDGEATRIEMTAVSLTLPRVNGAACSSATVSCHGLTGAVRGQIMIGPDGQPMRPDMVIIDDAQTRDSAKSPTQTSDREAIINDDVLGLAGPTTQIAAFMLCTVIYPDDLSDRFLSHDKHPQWQGLRTKMLVQFPKDMAWWDEYAEVRRESFRSGDEGRRANEFYIENRERADEGAIVSWPERIKAGEVSGIQSAMNLFIDNPRGFRSEYQNDPDKADLGEVSKEYDHREIGKRYNGVGRYNVPRECPVLTCGIDVGADVLWYTVMGWTDQFGGSVVDYGCWPRQTRSNFAANDVRPTLRELHSGMTAGQAVYQGLLDLTGVVLGRTYHHDQTGGEMRITKALVDCGYETDVVYQFVRASGFSGTLIPSKGIGRTATSRGVGEWKPRPGELSGHHWRLTRSETGRGQVVQYDPDFWKTFLHERFTTPLGARTAISLFGDKNQSHEMYANHIAAEYGTPVTLRGTTFDKWAVMPNRPDNHYLDCTVLATIAASIAGIKFHASGVQEAPRKPKPKVSAAEAQAQRRAAGPVNMRPRQPI